MSPTARIALYVGVSLAVSVALSVTGNHIATEDPESLLATVAPAVAAWVFGIGVCVLTFWMHFQACRMTYQRFISGGPEKCRRHPKDVLYAMLCLAGMHVGQSTMWGVAMYVGDDWLNLGEITGETEGAFIDYLNFSMATYTSLGIGDITPTDWLKVLTGLEALVGLLCIGWSVSMFVGKMGEFLEERQEEG